MQKYLVILLLSSLAAFGQTTNRYSILTSNEVVSLINNSIANSTNSYVDSSVGLELAKRIEDKLNANTNVFKIFIFGDSIGGWDIGGPGTGIHQILGSYYTSAGYAGRSVNLFGNGLSLYSHSVGANPAVVNQEAGTNWWSLWCSATNGATVQWDNYNKSNGDVANNLGLFWIAHPGGGDFEFKVSTNGGAFTTVKLLSGYAETRTARYTNINVAVNNYRVQAATTNDVNNIFIGAQIYDSSSNGVVAFYCFKGGANLRAFTNISQLVLDGVMTNYSPDLILYNQLDVPDIGTAQFESLLTNNLVPWFKLNTNAVVWLVGEAYRGDANDYMHSQENVILRRTALTNGFIFTDTRYDAKSWERSTNLNYMVGGADIVHFKQNGALFLGREALNKTGLLRAQRGAIANSLSVVSGQSDFYVTNNMSVGYSASTTPGYWLDQAGTQKWRTTTPGSGYMAMYFGTNTTQADYAGYALLGDNITTSLNVRDTASSWLSLRRSNVFIAGSTNNNEFMVYPYVNAHGGYRVGTNIGITTNIFVMISTNSGVTLNFTKGILTGVTP